jgi:hypothetical protein
MVHKRFLRNASLMQGQEKEDGIPLEGDELFLQGM